VDIGRNIGRMVMVAALAIGCASAYKVHPGAAGYITGNPTATQIAASQWYDDLSATDQVIQSTRAAFLAGKFPASAAPAIRTAFNNVVGAYDAAQSAWLVFNQSSAAGNPTGQAVAQAAVAAMDSAVQQLTAAKAVAK
jgi:hypothetical protein